MRVLDDLARLFDELGDGRIKARQEGRDES